MFVQVYTTLLIHWIDNCPIWFMMCILSFDYYAKQLRFRNKIRPWPLQLQPFPGGIYIPSGSYLTPTPSLESITNRA
jgi:hypothetical protein